MPSRSFTASRNLCLHPKYFKCAAAHLRYLDANLALKEEILAKTKSLNGGKPGRYKPDDELLAFLKGL
jgi:hypothetical protein